MKIGKTTNQFIKTVALADMKPERGKKPTSERPTAIQLVPDGMNFECQDNETPLFTANGAVLVELAEAGRYTYRAENLKTGKSITLGHRNDPLPDTHYEEIAGQMGRCAAGDAWLMADAADGSLFNEAKLQEMMKIIFERILPDYGYAPREKQIELARDILDSICRRDVALAEAEVGTGKTLAYLLPTVLARRSRINSGRDRGPIVVATSSIALQRAIERDYIPKLSNILIEHGVIKTPLTTVLRKGKAHYLCEHRFEHYRSYADEDTKKILEPLASDGIIDLAAAKNLTPHIKRAICVDSQCGKSCPKYGKCRYMRHMRDAEGGGYDFQVCNHNYLLADIRRRARGQKPLIPDPQVVVIDENHKLVDAARSMYGYSVSLPELIGIADRISGLTFSKWETTADINKAVSRIKGKSVSFFQFLNKEIPVVDYEDEIPERQPTKIRERTEKLMRTLKSDIESLIELLESKKTLRKYETSKQEALRILENITESLSMFIRYWDLVYWLEKPEDVECTDYSVLKGIPKNLGELLYKDMWSQKIPFILTSGTMSAAGSFEHIKRKTGLDRLPAKRVSETTKPSPFNYKENALIYICEDTPFPDNTNQTYIDSITSEVERLIGASNGHAAVLFTSYKAMDMVYERISARNLGYPLFRLERGSSVEIERFKKSGNGVLFASGSLWEGIDIPGDILSMLIIVRLPFAVPDPVSEWERTLYDSLEEYIDNVVVPEMLIKLKQGFGRLIRHETDTGCVAILDCRINLRGAYRRRVLSALPFCRVTSYIREVKKFLLGKKSAGYFNRRCVK